MKPATLTSLMLVALGFASSAQKFTLLPQIGFENTRTTLRYNDLPSFLPAGGKLSPLLGARMDYQFKKGHGPFLGVATSRSIVTFDYSDPETGMNLFKASAGDLRLHLEGGYQFSTKPIYFNKNNSKNKISKVQNEITSTKTYTKRGCGDYVVVKSQCVKTNKTNTASKSKGSYFRIQPSIGAAFIPSLDPDVTIQNQGTQASYKYQAGNWTSALITGVGFEFGKNIQRKFNLNFNYLRGIGNLSSRSITTESGGKTTVTKLSSSVSSWNLKAGIPITLYKKKTPVQQKVEIKIIKTPTEKKGPTEKKCGGYQYKAKCIRSI